MLNDGGSLFLSGQFWSRAVLKQFSSKVFLAIARCASKLSNPDSGSPRNCCMGSWVGVSWGLFCRPWKMVFQLWQGLVSLCSWLELDLYTSPSLMNPSDITYSGWVWGICEGLLTFCCFESGKVCRIYVKSPAVEICDPMIWFWNSVLLSGSIHLGHILTGRYWLIKVDTMVSADL